MNKVLSIVSFFFVTLLLGACQSPDASSSSWQNFEKLTPSVTGIDFVNSVENREDFNIFSYRNFYNGGGVAIGDINNDGLPDIFFTANMGANKLYLNKGGLTFEDITEVAGVDLLDQWSTGVTMVDVNGDQWLDIYVCNAGFQKGVGQQNALFINNGDLTFTDKAAAYGLDDNGYTTHAAFFDYDLDGDLDAYILNNSFIPVNTLNYSNKRDLQAEDWPVRDFVKGGGDKLMRNDGGVFMDVTAEAGIYSSLIGFGLGITVGDVNGDMLPDMYISNDFFERDYLYINQGDGTFSEEIEAWMPHISLSSMGADMADINNDGYPEIFVTEMLPDDPQRVKTKVAFENYSLYDQKLRRGFYHQYMHNTLQLNNTNNTFSDIAWYSGTAASDWSWGALFFDGDNDGLTDIYVCNGVYRDVTDQDFIDFFANDIVQQMVMTGEKEEMSEVINRMPSNAQVNKYFKNNGNLTFDDIAGRSGVGDPSFSNGAAYGDLDLDGDLDLVVNNLNQEAFVFKNLSSEHTDHHFIAVNLEGPKPNYFAIGAKVFVYHDRQVQNVQAIPSRGFQSSVDFRITMGLGQAASVDSIVVFWPDKKKSVVENPMIDTLHTISWEGASANFNSTDPGQVVFEEIQVPFDTMKEDEHVDFYYEGLIMRRTSREGPAISVADLNGDGRDDVFVGGPVGQPARMYFQLEKGWETKVEDVFIKDRIHEDTEVLFFDMDGDGDQDLFVGSGGNHQRAGSPVFQDRIYANDGQGNFGESFALPVGGLNTSAALPLDLEGDGDLDLIVTSRSVPQQYGSTPPSFILQNDGTGQFRDVTKEIAPDLIDLGMITDIEKGDLDGDGNNEIVLVGEWMAPTIFTMREGRLIQYESNLSEYPGWYYEVHLEDLNGDNQLDMILGNRGENFYFTASEEAPAKLWLHDFDDNGDFDKIITQSIDGKDMPLPMKRELTAQIPGLKKENLRHEEYAERSIQQLFDNEQIEEALVLQATWFKSSIAYNLGEGKFDMSPLPDPLQLSCICGIYCQDINGDGLKDIVTVGNDAGFTPQFSKLDAGIGSVLINYEGDFVPLDHRRSGLRIGGDAKDIVPIEIDGHLHLLVPINNDVPKLLKVKQEIL